jgi:PAS domain S-box-containing protein
LYCYEAYSDAKQICEGCPVIKTLDDGGIHVLQKKLVHGTNEQMIEIKSSPLRDPGGNIVAAIEAVRDITERKSFVEKLSLFSKAVEEAMDGIQLIDRNGYVMYSNKAVEKIYGFTPEELNGVHVNDMNADKEFASRMIIPQIRQNGRWSGEVMVVHKKGHTLPIWLSSSLVTDDAGNPTAMVGIIRDMTERRKAEDLLKSHREQLVKLVEERTGELYQTNERLRKEIADREKMEEELLKAQKLESMGILAGGIAHDFNNLLAAMLANISLAMLDVGRDHPAYEQLSAAEKASLRAQDLTRQLLTFSKGGFPVKRTTDLMELIEDASGFALRGSRVKCEISKADDLHLVNVDEGQISQVLHNLVLNADHAMPEGGTVSIHCSNVEVGKNSSLPLAEGSYVRVSVEDRGVGIPREHIAKIFDPYFTTKQKGSGLGLATSYSIVKKHGGHISVESKLGAGTTFNVYLAAAAEKRSAPRTAEAVLRSGSGTVLVMDDEADVRETTGKVLSRLGYHVQYARDGEEALKQYKASLNAGKPFDLVIMDLTVPGAMGGKEAIQQLIQIDPRVKAIVSSGYSNDPVMADFRSYGFAGVVKKPYRLRELSEEVLRVLSKNGGGEQDREVLK